MQRKQIGISILALALTVVFFGFGIDKFMRPEMWIGWVPAQLDGALTLKKEIWLQIIGAAEIIFAVLVVIPERRTSKIGSALMVAFMVAVLSQTGILNQTGVRDLSIALSALAFFFII